MAARKGTRKKKTAKKKTTRRKAAKKKSTKKGGRKKKATRKKSTAQRLEDELPDTLKGYSRKVRKQLGDLEKDVEKARAQASRRGTKLLREASEYLGKLEDRGEREWKKASTNVRKDAVKMLKKLEKAVAPKSGRKKKRKKKATRKKA